MTIPCIWLPASSGAKLSTEQIDIWRASLDLGPSVLKRLAAILTKDERARAERFHFERDRNHFIAARGALRELLGQYLNQSPARITIDCGPQGKPAVHSENCQLPIHFNLSHSHRLVVFAFACRREVGIDLELIRPGFAGEAIAKHYFSARELAELHALPPSLKAEGFFLCWTRKEAYVKARGDGLQVSLKGFDVSLTPGEPEKLQSVDDFRWSLQCFYATPQHVAAVVGEGKDWHLRHWEWMP